jgi:hypothetical protein
MIMSHATGKSKSIEISQVLGRANEGFTLQTYCHIMNQIKQNAAKLPDTVIPSVLSEKISSKRV